MHSSMTFLNSSLKQLVSGPTVYTLQFECQECDANAFSRLPGRCPGARQGMRQHDHRPHAPSWLLQSEMCRCQKVQSRLTCSAHPIPSYFHQGAAFNFTLKEVLSAKAETHTALNILGLFRIRDDPCTSCYIIPKMDQWMGELFI